MKVVSVLLASSIAAHDTLASPQVLLLQELSLLTALFIYFLVICIHSFLKNQYFPAWEEWGAGAGECHK